MSRLVAAVGPWPPLVALATFAALWFGTGGPSAPAGAEPGATVPVVWTTVPQTWLDGLQALRAGDATQALAALRRAEAGFDRAPVELLRVRLAAALAAADGVDAEATVEKLALRSGAEDLGAFVHGLAEAARAQLAARQAKLPGADPGAFDRAIRTATAAALAFATASQLHRDHDWPAARRNAERLLALRQDLVRQRDQQQRDRQREKNPDQPEPKPDPQRLEVELPRQDEPVLLSPSELQALLQRLSAAESEKRSVRRSARDARSAGVEQDW